MDASVMIVRILCSFFVLILLTRIMGRKEISQMTFFNFVSAIVIGTLGGALITDSSLNLGMGLLSLIGWSVMTILIGYLDIKSKGARNVVDGEPVVLIKEGKIFESALKRCRLDLDSLQVLLRKKDVFAIDDVETAIFEMDGSLSVKKKSGKEPLTRADTGLLQSKTTLFPVAMQLIENGKIISPNLEKLNASEIWLQAQLRKRGISSIKEVFYAELEPDGSLYVDQFSDK
ncbi:YetF domain-containing protein [Falsibacillus pallidus]|uniref:YetF domain-containing protein n=1 Tax=Falsibacillus pallidus TaxID=493781 RepID=UPI003D98756A